MDFSFITENPAYVLITVGVLLFSWSQKDKILGFLSDFVWFAKSEKKATVFNLTPAKRFEIFYALRSWCDENGHTPAVVALDDHVLVAIVLNEKPQ